MIFLVDGKILVGQLQAPSEAGLVYRVGGEDVTVPLGRIVRTEKSLDSLKEVLVEVRLKDGSTLLGTIVDYDEDVGAFVDIGFGVLTVPLAAIESLFASEQRHRYVGVGQQLRLGGGVYAPFTATESFGPTWTTAAGAVWSVRPVRGLFLGASATWAPADSRKNRSARYWYLTLGPTVEFRFLDVGLSRGLLSILTPFVGLGGGVSVIGVDNPSATPSRQNSFVGFGELSVGSDVQLVPWLSLRVDAYSTLIAQSGVPFVVGGGRLWLCQQF